MALRDVKEYYLSVEQSFLEMKKTAEILNAELKAGNVTEEQAEQATKLTQALCDNYNRLGYVMYLMAKPRKKDNKVKYDGSHKYLLKYFADAKATKECIDAENMDALKALKALAKEVKGEKDD